MSRKNIDAIIEGINEAKSGSSAEKKKLEMAVDLLEKDFERLEEVYEEVHQMLFDAAYYYDVVPVEPSDDLNGYMTYWLNCCEILQDAVRYMDREIEKLEKIDKKYKSKRSKWG